VVSFAPKGGSDGTSGHVSLDVVGSLYQRLVDGSHQQTLVEHDQSCSADNKRYRDQSRRQQRQP
jgi:hypothetical protein